MIIPGFHWKSGDSDQPIISKYYTESNYRLVQNNLALIAGIGVLYHTTLYILSFYYLNKWDSLPFRFTAILLLVVAALYFPKRNLTENHKWTMELLWIFELPVWFSLHLFMNKAGAFEASSILFAGAFYGLFVNPPKGLLFFPLSVLSVFTVLTFNNIVPPDQLISGLWLTIPAYMASISMGLVQMAIRKIVRDLEEKSNVIEIQKQKLQLANDAKSRFLAHMSHEIRTPMNAILGYSQIMADHLEQKLDPAKSREFLDHIISSGENLLMLINNVLDISKIEAGKMGVATEDLDLHRLLRNVYNTHTGEAKRKSLAYDLDIDENLPRIIHSDQVKLFQILMNLTSNAIKFTQNGSISITAHLVNDRILVVIRDEGIGISREHIKTIFDVFEQGDSSTTKTYGGSGLGLAISSQMAELLGGSVGVESEVGTGSTLLLVIPLVPGQEDSSPISKREIHVDEKMVSPILVVEDNELNRLMMEALFEELELPIETLVNGKVALDRLLQLLAENKLPQLVFMDIHMPIMDGIEAVKRIREVPELEDLKIVALSADANIERQNLALEVGFTDYLTKPFDVEKLIAVIRKYMPQIGVSTPYDTGLSTALFDPKNVSNFDKDVQKELIELFYSQIAGSLKNIAEFIETAERDQVAKTVHFIKGSALNLGAGQIAELCQKIHDGAAILPDDKLKVLVGELQQRFEETWNAISKYSSGL